MKYPEHEKLAALNGNNNVIGRFLDWLDEKEISLAVYRNPESDSLTHIMVSKADLIARHFDIDPTRLESEKSSMLDELSGAV